MKIQRHAPPLAVCKECLAAFLNSIQAPDDRIAFLHCAQLAATEGVGGWHAVLAAPDGQVTGLQIDLIPAQANRLADAKATAIHRQEQGAVAGAMAARCGSGVQQPFHLGRREVFPGTGVPIRSPPGRGDFPVFGVWGATAGFR
ncbi:MAG TPA: hypothetical protein VK251_06185 [Steroidobacteraceae bacterium]|jgi:hypothetical protein|nr:hypothetical protein [Steroidobacteraceae bacterium]